MPFNIELGQFNGTFIKLQVVKNVLTIYFNGNKPELTNVSDNWAFLENKFLEEIPEFNPTWIRGADPGHIKRSHTHSGEVDIEHFHREFRCEITPSLFEQYLESFYDKQQVFYGMIQYPFFKYEKEIKVIIEKYKIYYSYYNGSEEEKLFNQERRLTSSERSADEEANPNLRLLNRFLGKDPSLKKAKFNSPRAEKDDEEQVIGCSLM